MSKMRIVILGLAVGSAAVAAILAKGIIGKPPETSVVEVNKVPMVNVLVAAKDMMMGERLIDASISWREWPQSNITDAMITKDEKPEALTEFQNARARLPIFNGEPIVDKKLVLPGQNGFMSAILPKGMRAISVGVSEHSTAGGFILPNDRVDVLLTRKLDDPKTGQKIVNTETVLSGVRVLAINQTYRQEAGDDKVTVTEGKTATLELDPRQTEVIAMVESAGELSLALRSIAENGDKGMSDAPPILSEKYANNTGSGKSGTDRVIVRYGVESVSTSR
jgi:pilus assembly protein CpaB